MTCARRLRAFGLAALVLVAAGCAKPVAPPGPSEFALITAHLDTQLNASLAAARERLIKANDDQRIFAEELRIRAAGGSQYADWFLYQQKLLEIGGDTRGIGWFSLTPEGEAYVAAPPQRWLKAELKGAPQAVCAEMGRDLNCKVTGTAAIFATDLGVPHLAGRTVAEQRFEAQLRHGPQGWRVEEYRNLDGPQPDEAGRLAIYGDDEAIGRQRERFAREVNRLIQ